MILVTAVGSIVALLLVAGSRSIVELTAASLLVGVGSSVVQMILPYGVSLGPPEQRGRVVGSIMAGLLTGILLSRAVSGALGEFLGWRMVYVLAAVAMAALTVVLRVAIPRREPQKRLSGKQILYSLVKVFLGEPALQRHAAIGACGMASFSLFWSMLSFQLDSLGYGSAVAGTFGVVGVVGVFVAPLAARRAVGGTPARINLLGLSIVATSFAVFFLGARSLAAIGLGVVLLDAGVQASHLTNQTVIFGLRPEIQSRANALYMVSYFAGGALGTFGGSLAWSHGGWPAVCFAGAGFAVLGMLPLLDARGTTQTTPPHPDR